jgi:hypothetical protein
MNSYAAVTELYEFRFFLDRDHIPLNSDTIGFDLRVPGMSKGLESDRYD